MGFKGAERVRCPLLGTLHKIAAWQCGMAPNMEKIIVDQNNIGKRVDKFLAEEFFLYSRGDIVKKIKTGNVKINNKVEKPSYVLEEGDKILLENFSREEKKMLAGDATIKLDIIFESDDFVVINKQPGLQVHPSANEKEHTIVNALVAKFPEIIAVHDDTEDAYLRPGIVHRLDKDTSGVMVVAKNKDTFTELKNCFKDRSVEKNYIAIAQGIFSQKEGVIEKPIARSSSYRKQVIARNNTKTIVRDAKTFYKVLNEYDGYTLVEVFPKTGRMHQIRVHLSSIGHPIVGDLVYGENDKQEEASKVKRQMLHAEKLSFALNGKKYEFLAPMPQDFADFLANID